MDVLKHEALQILAPKAEHAPHVLHGNAKAGDAELGVLADALKVFAKRQSRSRMLVECAAQCAAGAAPGVVAAELMQDAKEAMKTLKRAICGPPGAFFDSFSVLALTNPLNPAAEVAPK